MDLLYMEYLRERLADDSIKELVIVPWSGWRDHANDQGEHDIKARIEALFNGYHSRITVVTAAMLQNGAASVFDNKFFEQVGSLGDSEFLRNASDIMGYRFRSYHDINRGHPETHQARSIIEHTIRGWLIYEYIEASFLSREVPPKSIGALMWERELTKLLMLRYVLTDHPDLECSLMLGDTVTYWRHFRKIPLPTYERGAVDLFADPDIEHTVLQNKSRQELRKTNRVLTDIIKQRGIQDLPSWGGSQDTDRDLAGLKGDALAVARSLRGLRKVYGISRQ